MDPSRGYAGPPPWTLHRVLTLWQLEPAVIALVVVCAAGYLGGVWRLRHRGRSWPPKRTVAFLAGLGLWMFTVCSGVGVYERVLFTDRAVQVVVLLMVVPLLLALGAPATVLVDVCGQRSGQRVRAALQGRVSRVLMFPLTSTVLLIAPPWLLYFTSWYQLSLTDDVFNALFHVGFVLFGLAYFWPRLQIDPVGHRYHPLIGIVITIAEVLFDAALGATLVFGSNLLVPGYWQALGRPWGMTVRADQSWGGAVLWGLGDIAGVPFLIALIVQVAREEHARTAAVDLELDARDEARHVLAGSDTSTLGRPWWETDPRFAERYSRPGPD